MARKPRLISAPAARGGGGGNTWRQQAGTMFAYSAEDGPIGAITDAEPAGAFEAPDDLNFERMVAERERELGLPNAVSGAAQHTPVYTDPAPVYTQAYRTPVEPADLGSLPDKFELLVERVNGSWKITSPLHVGLWRAGNDLPAVIEEALGALAMMISVDGPRPKGKKRRPIDSSNQ